MGDWTKAAGAYHSRTPSFAEKYAARFDTFRAKFRNEDGSAGGREIPEIPDIVLVANGGELEAARADTSDMRVAEMRVNSYPLLQLGGTGGLGSLVPLGNGGGVSMFGPRSAQTEVN